jgi:NAD-reducing hydrogenase large subunit
MSISTDRRRMVIEPVTRIEGHAKVTIRLDAQCRVRDARLHVVEFRGFERFVLDRPYWEVPVLVQRLCGMCPVSHHLAAAKAMDQIVGVDQLPPTAEKIRRLMHHGQIFQSHALHFFHLASPDLLFGFDAEPALRNVVGVAKRNPELALQGIGMRRFGQEIIEATAGKRIHGTGALPGGVNQCLSAARRDDLRAQLSTMLPWARKGVQIAREYTLSHLDALRDFGSFESNHLSLVGESGELDLYDGRLRCIAPDGTSIFDRASPADYLELIAEEVRGWSYMKFPFLRALGPEHGWYRVGPLARMNVCERIPTPGAEAARLELKALAGGAPLHMTMAYHWARMIEALHAIEVIGELLDDPDICGDDLRSRGKRREEAVAAVEAPRGTLIHHYRVDEDDRVTMANLIVSTTHNNEPMNRAICRVARDHLDPQHDREGMLNRIEVAIRAYDPCLSCATHAMGHMPLVVDWIDDAGNTARRDTRS